jgi:hypothetical protein
MKILCSGNPTHETIANGIKQIYTDAEFASRATGYDLRFWEHESETYFRNRIVNYNVFINASYLCKWGQHQLLEITHEVWSENRIKGHIINIGSSAELDGVRDDRGYHGPYSIQKSTLRQLSIYYNRKNDIKCTHVVVGGINDGKPGNELGIRPIEVAKTIQYALENSSNIPLLSII